jgi:hypothetical protein
MEGRTTVNHMDCLIVVVERLPHEVHVFSGGLTGSLVEHEVVKQRK